MKRIFPQRLRKGDLIGLVTPASPVADVSRIERGTRYLESLGYRVIAGEHVGQMRGYLAGTDEERVADLHAMFRNREVKAIICVRGGYGTPRFLSLLDYHLIARNPKILVGFSDITALQLAIWKRCGLITFHGPMAGVEMANGMDPFTEEQFWRCITSSKKIGRLPLPSGTVPEVLQGGKVSGHLLGGNLSLVISLLGTRFQPDYRSTILFLEEITEEPYRVDRMMTQLENASLLKKVRGMLLGQFTDCVPSDPSKPSLSTPEVLREAAGAVAGPVIANMPLGHVDRKLTLPVGALARMDTRKQSLEILEAAVR